MFCELLSNTRNALRSAAACQSLRRNWHGRPCHSPAQHADATGTTAASAADEWATACSAVGTGRWLAAWQTCFQQGRFLAIPSDLYGRPTYCPDLRSGVIYCKRLNPDTCESYVQEFYSPEAWRQMQAQQAQQTATPTQQYVPIEEYNSLVHRLDELEKWQKSFSKPSVAAKKGE